MRKILLAALAAVLTVSAHGQNKKITISGYIHDDTTGETLIGAGVVAAESSAIGAVTNDFGFYTDDSGRKNHPELFIRRLQDRNSQH